jgi:penicillin-binding protein 1A
MQTFRADIEAVNDNRARSRKLWVVVAISAVILLGLFAYFQAKAYLFKGLPDLPNKATMWEMNLKPNTTLLDRNGVIIGHRGPYVGRPFKLSEMPRHLPDAFLAIEDERFYQHAGIDRKAILRAFFENSKAGQTKQGGSTLTQQLVKTMVLSPEQTYRRKFQEAWLAYEMESLLSKPEILELYLNRTELGNRAFGVEAAAQRYFGKSAAQVNLSEAAMLAALPKAPSRLNPAKNYNEAWQRGKLVLRRMLANAMITPAQLSAAENNPPVIIAPKEDEDVPVMGHVFDLIAEQAKGLVGSKDKDLIIRTTLDPKMQLAAHKAVDKILEKSGVKKKVSEGAVVSIDNATGGIRALTGGRDYTASKFNRAAQAKRQPGSAFKAFVYAAALENGFTPGTVRIDQPTEIAGWAPENYTKRYRGPMTLREALKLSINTIAAQVGAEVGPPKVVDLGRRFGITTNLRSTYSISLGTSEVTLLDLTHAYSVFPNDGIRKPAFLIESISNTAGHSLYRRKELAPRRAFAQPYSKQMNGMLRDVIDSGTGHGARLGKRQAGGKTGTSQDHRDAWFIGYTADLTTGVWMGNDDNSEMAGVTGGLLPVDAWKAYMLDAHKGLKIRPLLDEAPAAGDEETQKIVLYYQSLAEQLTRERDLANGVRPAQTRQSSQGQNSVNTAGLSAGR